MKLRVLGHYRSGLGAYAPGQEFDIRDADGELLMRDSPGSFEVVGAEPAEEPEEEPEGDPPAAGIESQDRRQRGGKAR